MDHDSHVKAYHRYQIRKAVAKAAATYVAVRLHSDFMFRMPRRARWTWKNHVAHGLNRFYQWLEGGK